MIGVSDPRCLSPGSFKLFGLATCHNSAHPEAAQAVFNVLGHSIVVSVTRLAMCLGTLGLAAYPPLQLFGGFMPLPLVLPLFSMG
jgi:hypothetical protein